jgi:hypothetical protein
MSHPNLRQAVATTGAALVLLALAAPAAEAGKPVKDPLEPSSVDLIVPVKSIETIYPCICLPLDPV